MCVYHYMVWCGRIRCGNAWYGMPIAMHVLKTEQMTQGWDVVFVLGALMEKVHPFHCGERHASGLVQTGLTDRHGGLVAKASAS